MEKIGGLARVTSPKYGRVFLYLPKKNFDLERVLALKGRLVHVQITDVSEIVKQ